MEHPAEVAIVAQEWDRYAVLEKLCYATDALRVNGKVDRVRNGKLIMTVIDQNGNPLADAMAEEQFDLDFTLMAGELTKMLSELAEALGGETPRQAVAA